MRNTEIYLIGASGRGGTVSDERVLLPEVQREKITTVVPTYRFLINLVDYCIQDINGALILFISVYFY